MTTPAMNVSVGYESQGLGIGIESTEGLGVSPTKYIEIENETLANAINAVDVPGLHGQRSRIKTQRVQTTKDPRGGFNINGVKVADMDILAELILGDFGSGSSWPVDTLQSATLLVDKVHKRFQYAGCKFASAEFTSSASDQALKLAAEVVAMTCTEQDAAMTPSFSAQSPLLHRQATLVIGSDEAYIDEITTRIENTLNEEAFRNSQTRKTIWAEGDRVVNGSFSLDWNAANYHVYEKFLAHTWAALRVEYNDGTRSLIFLMPNVCYPVDAPQIAGRESMLMTANFEAQASVAGANDEIQIIVNDA